MNTNNDFKVDIKKLNELKHRIYRIERENHKTQNYTSTQMVERIRKIIEMEVDKDDN